MTIEAVSTAAKITKASAVTNPRQVLRKDAQRRMVFSDIEANHHPVPSHEDIAKQAAGLHLFIEARGSRSTLGEILKRKLKT